MGIFYSLPLKYDWNPDLPDFRDNVRKYSKKDTSSLPSSFNLKDTIIEPKKDYGSTSANSVATVLSTLGFTYSFKGSSEDLRSIRNCIEHFKIKSSSEYSKFEYYKLTNYKAQLRKALVDGNPIIIGLTAFESFASKKVNEFGVISQPKDDEQILGGVCVVIVGYDDGRAEWIIKHPFGKNYGDNGYIYIPYEILMKNNNLTTDFWCIKRL